MTTELKHAVRAMLLALCAMLAMALPAAAMAEQAPLRFGALAYRPKDQSQAQWQPLARYLETQMGRRVELAVYDFPELEQAITRNEVDIVLTNPGHFILLQHRSGLSSPLVTQTIREGRNEINSFAGVIFTRADTARINVLADLADKRIAMTSEDSFGGYQMQAFELVEAGVPLPRGEMVIPTGMPHDAVVEQVLSGQADAGFVRSGVLEAMVREGRLQWQRIKILHQQRLPAFPYAASTRLYPEWPVAVMPGIDEPTARQLTVALLSLTPDSEAARSAGLVGFTTPANYGGVDELLRRLRKAPYDVRREVTPVDLWLEYRNAILGLSFALVLIGAAGVRLVLQSRRLRQSRLELLESQKRYQSLVDLSPIGVLVHSEGKVVFANPAAVTLLRVDAPETLHGCSMLDLVHETVRDAAKLSLRNSLEFGRSLTNLHLRLACADGMVMDVDVQATPIVFAGVKAMQLSFQDISERRRAESRLKLFASVFTHAREGILITDAHGILVEINDTFTDMTGYSPEEALGKNPRILLHSGLQSEDFYIARQRALDSSGHWSGEVWNKRKNGEVFAAMLTISAIRDEDGVLQNYVAVFTDITPAKEHQRQLERIAHYDPLTSMPNRVLLADRLQQAMLQCERRKLSLAVAFLDLDGFKAVNDKHGHEVGDALLVGLAHRMKAALREGDTLARIGGDEFVAVMGDLENAKDCEPMLERLLLAAADPVHVGQVQLQVSASVGVTLYPQDGADAEQLLRHADQAMYLAKQAGKNRFHLFDVAHDAAVQTQREGVERIRLALRQREFVLYYQPKVNMKTGVVVGLEALIRWQHPERGLVPPAEFLPLVEDHPLGVELGTWVLESALSQMAAWRADGLDIPVSVNVSALQLQDPGFSQSLAALLRRYPGVSPQQLELEVLETTGMNDVATVAGVMAACSGAGVQFALDDFGTGYSSLTYLKALPAETLKIDQSFVRDMLTDADDLAIVKGVIGLAQAFKRNVIAEGVETLTHGELLLSLGCNLAQGYGIARPMPAALVPEWVVHWQSVHAPVAAAILN